MRSKLIAVVATFAMSAALALAVDTSAFAKAPEKAAAAAPAAKKTQCRDDKGKFIKCPAADAKPKKCRDPKGKFIKCDAAGAKPE